MFSSALKSFSSNISSNYTISQQPSSTAGPWKIYDAKKKSTGKAASVFIFEKKSLEPHSGSVGRSGAASLKRAHEEVIERLKKEASSLARLRHPSILELAEPVEETRNGGLMFATEPVTASLAGLLQEKDDEERAGGVGGRSSRYVIEEADGKGRKRRELEIDELEIQKGLLQIGKGLEFMHESAGLVHSNLTPEAIFINAKSDWKISGLAFAGPASNSTTTTSITPISLSEVLNHDPRLPRSVQLNLDYTSPDFVLDNNITAAADMFSLGILIVTLYNSPHRSPLETNGSLSGYKRLFNSSSTVPTQNNNFMSSQPVPKDLVSGVLPRLITRRPAQRLSAREFQQAQYFDNILVSTIRFLDSLPAKTPNEKSQFMRGLPRILNQFPKSVLEKKVLPALLEEMKDKDLLALILQNVFKIITAMPSGKRAFGEVVIPRLRETFIAGGGKPAQERDSQKEAGLMVLLENIKAIADNSSGKEFKDDILPIIIHAMESPTHSLIDAALGTLPTVLPVLDFSTIKNELFPIIAAVFAKTSSMGIKIRGLEALQTLCGGSSSSSQEDDLNGINIESSKAKQSNPAVLDKYTIQEKVVPLLKAIKTKEPAVMMAALDVFKEVGKIADSEFIAMDVLPILWNFALGPLLNLQQFQAFMTLIRSLSTRVEQEQTRKLQELSATGTNATSRSEFMTFGSVGGTNGLGSNGNNDDGDFESLVTGRKAGSSNEMFDSGWDNGSASSSTVLPMRPTSSNPISQQASAAKFSWSTSATSPPLPRSGGLGPSAPTSRTITPDHTLSSFTALTPMNNQASPLSQVLQPSFPGSNMSVLTPTQSSIGSVSPSALPASGHPSINWSSASNAGLSSTNMWASQGNSMAAAPQTSVYSIPPPQRSPYEGFGIAPPPSNSGPARQGNLGGMGISGGSGGASQATMGQRMGASRQNTSIPAQGQQQPSQGQRQGLDKYESLL